MSNLLLNLFLRTKKSRGQTLVEYAILLFLVGGIAWSILWLLGGSVSNQFNCVNNSFASQSSDCTTTGSSLPPTDPSATLLISNNYGNSYSASTIASPGQTIYFQLTVTGGPGSTNGSSWSLYNTTTPLSAGQSANNGIDNTACTTSGSGGLFGGTCTFIDFATSTLGTPGSEQISAGNYYAVLDDPSDTVVATPLTVSSQATLNIPSTPTLTIGVNDSSQASAALNSSVPFTLFIPNGSPGSSAGSWWSLYNTAQTITAGQSWTSEIDHCQVTVSGGNTNPCSFGNQNLTPPGETVANNYVTDDGQTVGPGSYVAVLDTPSSENVASPLTQSNSVSLSIVSTSPSSAGTSPDGCTNLTTNNDTPSVSDTITLNATFSPTSGSCPGIPSGDTAVVTTGSACTGTVISSGTTSPLSGTDTGKNSSTTYYAAICSANGYGYTLVGSSSDVASVNVNWQPITISLTTNNANPASAETAITLTATSSSTLPSGSYISIFNYYGTGNNSTAPQTPFCSPGDSNCTNSSSGGAPNPTCTSLPCVATDQYEVNPSGSASNPLFVGYVAILYSSGGSQIAQSNVAGVDWTDPGPSFTYTLQASDTTNSRRGLDSCTLPYLFATICNPGGGQTPLSANGSGDGVTLIQTASDSSNLNPLLFVGDNSGSTTGTYSAFANCPTNTLGYINGDFSGVGTQSVEASTVSGSYNNYQPINQGTFSCSTGGGNSIVITQTGLTVSNIIGDAHASASPVYLSGGLGYWNQVAFGPGLVGTSVTVDY